MNNLSLQMENSRALKAVMMKNLGGQGHHQGRGQEVAVAVGVEAVVAVALVVAAEVAVVVAAGVAVPVQREVEVAVEV